MIGDPLDVIASGPTAADPTTFADAIAVLDRHGLTDRTPPAVLDHLRRGAAGAVPETLKELPPSVHNLILGNNAGALSAAARRAVELGYPVLNLGSFIDGETRHVAAVFAGVVRSIRADGQPVRPPVCVLSGGETTVTLTGEHGKGGRNQEFVLAAALKLGAAGLRNVVVLSGGTDGEDGPTDAAGAVADGDTLARRRRARPGRRGLPGPPRRLFVFRRRRRPAPHRLDANQRHGRARDPDRDVTTRCHGNLYHPHHGDCNNCLASAARLSAVPSGVAI